MKEARMMNAEHRIIKWMLEEYRALLMGCMVEKNHLDIRCLSFEIQLSLLSIPARPLTVR